MLSTLFVWGGLCDGVSQVLGNAEKLWAAYPGELRTQYTGWKKRLAVCRFVGHIMTMTPTSHLKLPDPNNPGDIDRHRDAVLVRFSETFGLVDSALRDSIPKAKNMFALLGGYPDRAVHAMNTRYLMKVFLQANEVSAEEQSSNGDLNIEWVPNCGLFAKLPEADIRILKTGPFGVPKATSAARSRYYSSNQMLLRFSEGNSDDTPCDLPLTLVLLWDIDEEFKYLGLEVACPRTAVSDGSVDCFWIAKWNGTEQEVIPATAGPTSPGPDLEGIAPIDANKSRAAKA